MTATKQTARVAALEAETGDRRQCACNPAYISVCGLRNHADDAPNCPKCGRSARAVLWVTYGGQHDEDSHA